ncbi:hypothetical protein QZH41_007987 [Actinostola sp. cb2023]|nr:hypothetical protein QZH41_007987 [Actinostola sp. cb2023]
MRTQRCNSANYFIDGMLCEMNGKNKKTARNVGFVKLQGWIYFEKMTMCQSYPCLNNGVCSSVFASTVDSYKCTCPTGFAGQHCEKEISGYRKEYPAISCKGIYDQLPSSPSGLYYFKNVSDMSTPYQAHCAMDVIDGCGGKGWSLVMKIDGHKA